ncbi:MAG: hypothetical protein JW967_06425 [Dehalococcoidales bacterium]|nr:hypothetical protein [Dehalococcoidales bacterium]
MKRRLFVVISIVSILLLFITNSVLANDTKNERILVDTKKFPELTCDRYGVFEGDNLVDPNNPNYDPSLVYGPEGSRFGPPGKRNLDFYRSIGWNINEESVLLEKDLNKKDPWPGDAEYGTFLRSGKSVQLVQAYQKIYPTITLNESGDFLYAPTLLGPDNCRIESVASYVRSGTTTYRRWQVFVHSTTTPGDGSWYFVANMDIAFCNRYGGTANEVLARIENAGGSPTLWKAYIYDRIDYQWDLIWQTYGTRPNSEGWDAWEEWYLSPNWPTLPQITSRYLDVQVSGTLYVVTNTYGYLMNQGTAIPYTKSMINNYYYWSVGP